MAGKDGRSLRARLAQAGRAGAIVWLAATPIVILVGLFASQGLLALAAGETAPWLAFLVTLVAGSLFMLAVIAAPAIGIVWLVACLFQRLSTPDRPEDRS